ncbi:M56 family metallopeptidase [Flavobacterium pedocola]
MILYLIKSGLCLLALFGIYHFVLGRERMYQFNRFYLLVSLAFGLLIPFNTIEEEAAPVQQIANAPELTAIIGQPAVVISEAQEYFTLENILLGIYSIITLLLLFRFAKNLVAMFLKIRRSKKLIMKGYTLILTPEKTLPYTFLSYIFMNEDDFNHDTIETELLDHEKTHVQQRHSVDILFIELLQVFFWFQPALYGFKNALRFNHEFLADEAVLQKAVPAEQYQNLILAKITHKKPVPFSSNLAYLVTKKRFIMMTRQTSKIKEFALKLAVLPLLTGLTVSFSTYEEIETTATKTTTTVQKTGTKPKTKQQERTVTDAEYFAGVRFNVCEKIQGSEEKPLKWSKTYEEFTPEDHEKFGKWFANFRQKPTPKQSPTSKELNDFKNSKKYAIWIDGVNVPNSKLNQYEPKDFASFSGSVILKNARTKKHPQPFQYWFYTQNYYVKNKMGEPILKYPGETIDLTISKKPEKKTTKTTVIQESKNPDFPGGIGEFMKYFATNFKYPENLKTTEPLRLVASFNVTKEGTVNDIKVLKGYSPEIDQEIIRVLKASPKWIPGEKDGKKTDAQMTIPIQLQPR